MLTIDAAAAIGRADDVLSRASAAVADLVERTGFE
jgi:hypothetical protein